MISLRNWVRTAALTIAAVLVSATASAQIVQTVTIGGGVFYPRGYDSRHIDDTLVANLNDPEPLAFNIDNFTSGTLFGEWGIEMGHHVTFSAGLSYYSDAVPSVYLNVVNANGAEIPQELRLRTMPITGIVRFMPFGSPTTFQPYIGAGVGIIPWRYSESGQFVDGNSDIFTDRFIATGTAFGPLMVFGFRAPVGGDIYALTMEWRYQFATGNTGGLSNNFLGEKIDLSGGNLNFGFLVRF